MNLFISFFIFTPMENTYFKGETEERGLMFIIALVAMLIFTIMGAGVDVDQYLQHAELKIPGWYFYIIFSVDVMLVVSLLLIYFYRKIGVFLYPLMAALHFYFHMYYLDTFLYTDVTNLFLFVGVGLLAIIPKWQFFK